MIRELHITVYKDDYDTYITKLLEKPPPNQDPADIYELYGYRVGVYPQDGLSMTVVHTVVRDVVQRLATNDGLE